MQDKVYHQSANCSEVSFHIFKFQILRKSRFAQITQQKNAQKRAKLIALHAQKDMQKFAKKVARKLRKFCHVTIQLTTLSRRWDFHGRLFCFKF